MSALFKGETKAHPVDRISLGVAMMALIFWWFTKDPTISVILITVADAIGGFVPTFRKAWHKPFEETISTYRYGSLYYMLSLFALESYSIATTFYPATIVLVNSSFVVMVLIRRKKLSTV